MAHKMGTGSTQNGRDSRAQRRGIKKYGGEHVRSGNILVRQVGGRFKPGRGAAVGKDYTIFAVVDGQVSYRNRFVDVVPVTPVPG